MVDDFWKKVDKSDDCWEWIGYREKSNYGRVSFRGNNKVLAHRASWILTNGDIPDGLCVLHECDNPPCVNPNHLFLGTHKDNARDRDEKGRGALPKIKGSKHWNAKFHESDVRVIKELLSVRCKQKAIAWLFDVGDMQISNIKHGRIWGHV